MALREFTVTLVNETPCVLRMQKVDLSTGNWGEAPPESIAAGAEGRWRSESPGWFRGTEGEIEWLIQDKGAFLGDDEHPGKQGCLGIFWKNPYVGAPETQRSFRACADLLNSEDPSKDYIIELAFGSTSSPEMMGWKEAVLGNPLAALGGVGHISVWFRLRPRGKVFVNGGLHAAGSPLLVDPPSSEPLKLISIKGGPAGAWSGRWADIISGIPSLEVDIVTEKSAGYAVGIRENPSLGLRYEGGVSVTQERATPYKGNIWTIPETSEILFHPEVIWPAISEMTLVSSAEVKSIPVLFLGPLVDTIRLRDSTWLQLYGDYDSKKKLVRYRVRYLRTNDHGKTVLDVMLFEYKPLK